MRKNIYIFLSLFLSAMLAGACSSGGKNGAAADSDSVSAAEVRTDTTFQTPDLSYAELRGNVRRCVLRSVSDSPDGMSLTVTEYDFDTSGRLLRQRCVLKGAEGEFVVDDISWEYAPDGSLRSCVNHLPDGDIELRAWRDADGRLQRIQSVETDVPGAYETDYEWDGWLPTGERYSDANGVRRVAARYDGQRIKSRTVDYRMEDGDITESYLYSYEETDAAGNWTRRTADVTLSQSLTEASEDDVQLPEGPLSLTETREIEYYPAEDM